MVTISPQVPTVVSTLLNPLVTKILLIFPVLRTPSLPIIVTCWATLRVPWVIRPIPSLPKKSSYPRFAICIWSGSLSNFGAGGTKSMIVWNKGEISFCSSLRFLIAIPCLAIAYTTVNSACSSVAPREMNKSKSLSITQFGLEVALSILLITTMGLRPNSRDFLSTNFVWGIGPS